MANNAYEKIAIGDIGTQVFWFNQTSGKFQYAIPVTAGAEFGGDTESFDAPETDLDYVPKISGRTTLNDISYTVNYTAEKYKRIVEISSNTELNTYMEVFSDGSATIFKGTSGRPTITSGDVRQITWTVAPQFMLWVENIYELSQNEKDALTDNMYSDDALNLDIESIPSYRPDYFAKKNAPTD